MYRIKWYFVLLLASYSIISTEVVEAGIIGRLCDALKKHSEKLGLPTTGPQPDQSLFSYSTPAAPYEFFDTVEITTKLQEQRRASESVREERLRQLSFNQCRILNRTDAQLHEQWGGATLTIIKPELFKFFGDTSTQEILKLGRGDHLTVRRYERMSKTDLIEILHSKKLPSHFYSASNFNLSAMLNTLRKNRITLEVALNETWAHGFWGISTSYTDRGSDMLYEMPEQVDWTYPTARIIFEIKIPAEALVLLKKDANGDIVIPQSIRENPLGFAFIRPDTFETEATSVDFVPPDYLNPEWMQKLKKSLD